MQEPTSTLADIAAYCAIIGVLFSVVYAVWRRRSVAFVSIGLIVIGASVIAYKSAWLRALEIVGGLPGLFFSAFKYVAWDHPIILASGIIVLLVAKNRRLAKVVTGLRERLKSTGLDKPSGPLELFETEINQQMDRLISHLPREWTPKEAFQKGWAGCDTLEVPAEELLRPFVLTLRLHPQKNNDWRAGVFFFKDMKRDSPRVIFHASRDTNHMGEIGYSAYLYWDQDKLTLRDAEDALKPPKAICGLSLGSGLMRLVFLKHCLILSLDDVAWVLTNDHLEIENLGNPYLAHWWEGGFSQVFFKDVSVQRTVSNAEILLLEHLAKTTGRLVSTIKMNPKVLEAFEKLRFLRSILNKNKWDTTVLYRELRDFLMENKMKHPQVDVDALPTFDSDAAEQAILLAWSRGFLTPLKLGTDDLGNVFLKFNPESQ